MIIFTLACPSTTSAWRGLVMRFGWQETTLEYLVYWKYIVLNSRGPWTILFISFDSQGKCNSPGQTKLFEQRGGSKDDFLRFKMSRLVAQDVPLHCRDWSLFAVKLSIFDDLPSCYQCGIDVFELQLESRGECLLELVYLNDIHNLSRHAWSTASTATLWHQWKIS